MSSTKKAEGRIVVLPVAEMPLEAHAHELRMQGWTIESLDDNQLRALAPQFETGGFLDHMRWSTGRATIVVERKDGRWEVRARTGLKQRILYCAGLGAMSAGAFSHGFVRWLIFGSLIAGMMFLVTAVGERRHKRTTILEFKPPEQP